MSLNVILKEKKIHKCNCKHCELNGKQNKLYSANITHNLGEMAGKAGIYEALWRPYRLHNEYVPSKEYEDESNFEKSCIIKAKEIVPLLKKGLSDLKKRPEYFKQFDSDNGWGLYIHFVPFVEKYLEACIKYPNSIIEADR